MKLLPKEDFLVQKEGNHLVVLEDTCPILLFVFIFLLAFHSKRAYIRYDDIHCFETQCSHLMSFDWVPYADERTSREARALENDEKDEGRKEERKERANKTPEFHVD